MVSNTIFLGYVKFLCTYDSSILNAYIIQITKHCKFKLTCGFMFNKSLFTNLTTVSVKGRLSDQYFSYHRKTNSALFIVVHVWADFLSWQEPPAAILTKKIGDKPMAVP